MKLILFGDKPHHKNFDAIQRMCKSHNIDFEFTNSFDKIKSDNYDILYSMCNYIDINTIPSRVKIIMGPQLFVFPCGPIVNRQNMEFSKRAVYNVLSSWIKDLYLEFADDFIIPMKELPFSVDTQKFQPISNNFDKELDCIVYIKRRSNDLVENTLSLLNQKKLKYKIFKYGSYNEDDYLQTLQKTKFMIVLDAHESQGFALEEAMSVNIPLLIMDATSMYDEMDDGISSTYSRFKPKKLLATSVPYWSDECGIKITESWELSNAIDKLMIQLNTFTPRNYILRTLSDEVCMKRIIDYFKL